MIKYTINIFVLFFIVHNAAYAEPKDATLRDEDISATLFSVEYFTRPDGLFEYVYTIENPENNKGIISTILMDLSCDASFEPVTLPDSWGRPGYLGAVPAELESGTRTPTAIQADYGAASTFGLTTSQKALWGTRILPGQKRVGLRLISPAAPGMRQYNIEPWLDYDDNWLMPDDENIYVPHVWDFAISGMIEGPGCPGKTEPPQTARYLGTVYRGESDEINNLLSYGELQQDRFHVAARTKDITLHIYYANELDAKTFKVEPAWMKRFFTPVAGSDETVTLPLKKERNKIKLSVHTTKATGSSRKNNEAHHSYKDTDVFEIRVDK